MERPCHFDLDMPNYIASPMSIWHITAKENASSPLTGVFDKGLISFIHYVQLL